MTTTRCIASAQPAADDADAAAARYLPAVTMLRRTRAWSCDPTGSSVCYVEATSNDVLWRSGVRAVRVRNSASSKQEHGRRRPAATVLTVTTTTTENAADARHSRRRSSPSPVNRPVEG